MGTYTHHEPCPRCGSRDNMARYSDGGSFCFGCSYTERAGMSPFVKEREHANTSRDLDDRGIRLPDDLCFDFPMEVVTWLARYGITIEEAIRANIKWSPSWEQLTFLFTDENNNVLFTQARNFNSKRSAKQKYYNQGSPAGVLPIFRAVYRSESVPARMVVITEDALSSLKIARQCDAMPALGTHLPARKITALKALNYQTLLIWLDSDKWKEAVEIATMAKWLGLSARTIYTELDPKEYTDEQIRQHIEGMAS